MPTAPLEELVVTSIADRRLLDHPFYRRWEQGEVTMNELASYASQYRHFEAWLPGFLGRLVDELPTGSARDFIAANLDDELGDPVPHIELFEGFAQSLGAGPAVPSPAMAHLLATYGELADEGPCHALAGFVAYEYQAPEVARSKADGLRSHYGLTDGAVAFWEHHADVDIRHATWALSALAQFPEAADEIGASVGTAAEAWWHFLDEREAAVLERSAGPSPATSAGPSPATSAAPGEAISARTLGAEEPAAV